MSGAKKLMFNTALLTVASFVMRTVSLSFNVYLTNKTGESGIGLFQLIGAVYGLAAAFAVSGVKLASTRLVADDLSHGNSRGIVNCCLKYSLLCGLVTAIVLFTFAGFIGRRLVGDNNSVNSLKILAFSLPFVSFSAALNGYFTAIGRLVPYTVVQVFEQLVKITITVFLLNKSDCRNTEQCCSCICIGMTCAEIISFFCSFVLYRKVSRGSTGKSKGILSHLLKISVPDAAGTQMRSILMTVEHLLIPVGLKKSGADTQTAIASYGVVHGMALPVVLYPSALLSSLSGLLVPEISSQFARKNNIRISYMISRVIHITLIFSIGTAGIMFFEAQELSTAIYGNTDSAFYMSVLSPLIPVMYLDMTVDGILKGLNQQVSYMKYNIIDASLCVVLVWFLIPKYSVKGYVFVIFISECINFFLSFRRMTVVAEVRMDLFRDIILPLLCITATCFIKKLFFSTFIVVHLAGINVIAGITFSATLYFVLLRLFDGIDREEMKWIKSFIKIKTAIS